MTITLTREEAQQVLDALDFASAYLTELHAALLNENYNSPEIDGAIETLRARLAKKEFVVPPIDGDTTPWARSDEGW